MQERSAAKIAALLKKAEPLRGLDEDHPDKVSLGPIVDEINALRRGPIKPEPEPDIDPEVERVKASLVIKRPLRQPRRVA